MARHEVEMLIPHGQPLGITDVVFRVRSDDRLLGTVRISQGSIDFTPRNGKRLRLDWDNFAELMRSGRPVARKPIPPNRRATSR